MSIPHKVRVAIEDGSSDDRRSALLAVLDKAEAWRAEGMPWSALGDELLLTVGPPLGLRLKMGPFAQIIDLDEEGQ